MTTLERRCRLLLRAYPAAYRRDRGEEIIGTLLEATPDGRSWPLGRDVRGLAIGGLRARAALNRSLTTGANLCTAVTVGAATFLAGSATTDLVFGVRALKHRLTYAHLAIWPLLLSGALVGLAVALLWVTSRKAVLVAGVLAAAVAVSLAGPWRWWAGWPVPELACLAAVALLAGRGKRASRGRLWPMALVVVWVLAAWVPGVWPFSTLAPLAAMGIITLLWAVIDARPAVAMAVFLLANWLPLGIASVVPFEIAAEVPVLTVIVIATVAVWLLRRQSASVAERRGS